MAKKYGNEIRAKAEAMFRTGESLSAVASALSIDKSTCSRWKAAMPATALQQIEKEKTESYDQLVFAFLTEMLRSLVHISREIQTPGYILSQKASDVALLSGVLSDKTFRLLEALQDAGIVEGEVTAEDVRNMSDEDLNRLIADGINRGEMTDPRKTKEPPLNYDEFAKEFSKAIGQQQARQE